MNTDRWGGVGFGGGGGGGGVGGVGGVIWVSALLIMVCLIER